MKNLFLHWKLVVAPHGRKEIYSIQDSTGAVIALNLTQEQANLILAAPDLYKALDKMHGEFLQYDQANADGSTFEKVRVKLISAAERSLAKAKGGKI